ncbi:GDP-mannose 4,6-dehydratase [Halalkaliarchaeum sp. AArc-GB]|uniref:GDP-mannose 4,6-dehydratase n=1 Tax=Halalkaliarchaeum sp. AArc-GB TaxID=3074078 RepID=UPI0028571D7F|nr:GDP-mannose 4,6-dehydratase [Halalkaliarchaeum sp. AArc-GB]MDR5673675.1 GDP-mannose 4,6-dehydratase [Halalkaliarchaeum sp. AArc-GB]
MTILITGGGGFIGSHLVDHLLEETGERILVLDNFSTGSPANIRHIDDDRLAVRDGDVRDDQTVENVVSGVDSIYHLAAAVGVEHVVENPLASLRTNLHGTENVLEAAREHDVPTFLASSSEVYGKSEAVPFSEADDRVLGPTSVPRWGYAAAKATDEFLALSYHETYDLPVTVGRYFNIVGPRQTGKYGMVIPTFVEQALSGEPLTVYGDGTQTRSFTHVADAVELTHELLETPEAHGEVFNVGAPDPTSITDLAERVIELTGSDSEITHVPFEEAFGENFEEPDQREPDVSKLQSVLGWAPEADLDRILEDVIEEQSELHPKVI